MSLFVWDLMRLSVGFSDHVAIKLKGFRRIPSLILIVLIANITLLSTVCPAYGEPPEAQLKQQVKLLKNEVRALREQQRSMMTKHDQLSRELQLSETRLLKRDFQPQVIRSMRDLTSSLQSSKARSPLPKKRARIRYLAHAQDRTQKRDLRALLQRGPVLIALWATWCKPCVSPREQAHLSKLKRRLQTYGIPLLSIGVDQWSKIKRSKERWFYPLWHVQDAHLNLTPEQIFKDVGLGLPLFFLRLPDGSVPYFLDQTLSDQSVEEWVTLAVRAKLSYSFE